MLTSSLSKEEFLDKWRDEDNLGTYEWEVCKLGACITSVPVSTLHDKDVLLEVFSMDSWAALSDNDREYLRTFLPKGINISENELLLQLFNPQTKFYNGSPLQNFVSDLNSGKYNAAMAKYQEQLEFMREKNRLIELHARQLNLIRKIAKLKESHGLEVEKELREYLQSPHMQEMERKSLNYSEKLQQKTDRKRKRQALQASKYYSSTWNKFLMETEDNDSEGSSTDSDSDINPSDEDEDYEEFMKKAKRHKQYKTKRKEKADAALVEAEKSQGKKMDSETSSMPVFALFSTLKDILADRQIPTTLNEVVEAVANFSELKANIPPQYSLSNFVDLALHFLANPPKLSQGGVDQPNTPLVEHSTATSKWKWTSASTPELLGRLESLEQIFFFAATRKKLEYNEKDVLVIPSSFIKQTKCLVTVPETTAYGVTLFHQQEKERFENHEQPYTFDILGVKSLVAPLKGFVGPSIKAREHALLVDNRPAHINLLSLIRNAAARLPGGVGTRADVSQLMRDSQYVKEGCPDKKLNQVVSGGLDRLQSFPDPPVKFDPDQKLWIYTHRLRSLDHFKAESDIRITNKSTDYAIDKL